MTNWMKDAYPNDFEIAEAGAINPDREGYQYDAKGGNAHKLVLTGWPNYDPPKPMWEWPPHFTFDLRPGYKAVQHISLQKAAYGLYNDKYQQSQANYSAGRTISCCIIGLPNNHISYSYFDNIKMKRLAFFIVKIGLVVGIPVEKFPFPFNAYADNTEVVRQQWDVYKPASGIMGACHDPMGQGRWVPGRLDWGRLMVFIHSEMNNEKEEAKKAPQGPSDNVKEANPEAYAPVVPEETAEAAPLEEHSMESKPFRFNPPLHRGSMPKRVDFSGTDPAGFLDPWYKSETMFKAGTTDASPLQQLRLGRIIQHEMAAGFAALNEQRYGFRFLYNPTSVTTAASRNDSVLIDPQSSISAVISGINQNFQTIRFQIFLNRTPDVQEPSLTRDDYYVDIDDEDLTQMRVYGTHWDLEYLYRLCNGLFNLDDRGKTGDIGVLVPSNARLLLGPSDNHFGFVESVHWTDQVFSSDMVPIITTADIVFRRHVDMAPMQMGEFMSALTSSGVAGGTQDAGGGGAGTYDPIASGPGGPTGGGSHGVWPNTNNCCEYGGGAGGPLRGEPNVYGTFYVAPAILQLQLDLNAAFPNRSKIMDGTAGWGAHHVNNPSDHNPVGHINGPKYGSARTVHALDFAIDGLPVDRVLSNLKRDPRVQYVIHKEIIYSRTRNFAPSKNSDHEKHIHLSLRSDNQQIAEEVEKDTARWVL